MSRVVKIERDNELDVAYISLRKGHIDTTVELRPGILFDLDKNGQVLGIEVLSLSQLAPALKAVGGQAATKRKRSA